MTRRRFVSFVSLFVAIRHVFFGQRHLGRRHTNDVVKEPAVRSGHRSGYQINIDSVIRHGARDQLWDGINFLYLFDISKHILIGMFMQGLSFQLRLTIHCCVLLYLLPIKALWKWIIQYWLHDIWYLNEVMSLYMWCTLCEIFIAYDTRWTRSDVILMPI